MTADGVVLAWVAWGRDRDAAATKAEAITELVRLVQAYGDDRAHDATQAALRGYNRGVVRNGR